ncbi:single-stranded DNA-binding protein, partial [Sphaerochaeta sp.]|uniref:single-stranded DNA-binding protein n=1 Tax=Sphaerochaeta sp. TaxID=1972642 RepID=UPI003D13ACE6
LEVAFKEAENLKKGESFLLKDLFKCYLWNRIPRGGRFLLGSLFLSNVSSQKCSISVIHKGVSGQQRYVKKSRQCLGIGDYDTLCHT